MRGSKLNMPYKWYFLRLENFFGLDPKKYQIIFCVYNFCKYIRPQKINKQRIKYCIKLRLLFSCKFRNFAEDTMCNGGVLHNQPPVDFRCSNCCVVNVYQTIFGKGNECHTSAWNTLIIIYTCRLIRVFINLKMKSCF